MDQYSTENNNYLIPPIKPFDNFKWRWAVTTPSEGINTPEILIGVLRILYKHNGQKHTTQEFQDDLLELQNKLNTKIDLAKVDRGLNKNIIENSGQYWKAIGLLENSTGGYINLTKSGIRLAENNNIEELIADLVSDFNLPNIHIESENTISEWVEHSIEISPIKLIFKILIKLKQVIQSPTAWYISPEELKTVIIPLSIYPSLPLSRYVSEVIAFRENPSAFEEWPNCTPEDNDFRMVKEYLIFLSNFGHLDTLELKDKSKRYYLNEKSLKLFKDDIKVETVDVILPLIVKQVPFDLQKFLNFANGTNLTFPETLIQRFISSLATKPFALLTGLSGSGKTKLAEAFVMWICQDKSQYKLVPVGADWTNREPLLGFPNALDAGEYVHPDNGVLQLVMNAQANQDRPFFLILDEMNLSHVERYFADFLSTMESSEAEIQLHDKQLIVDKTNVPKILNLPKNLYIIGTVNIDETTYMFSPKVLDRANTIEFRVTKDEIEGFFEEPKDIELKTIVAAGASYGKSFLDMSKAKSGKPTELVQKELVSFFEDLQKTGAEFGYRTANEMVKLITNLEELGIKDENQSIDIAIMQKMLPKLNGSRRKLSKVLISLGTKCLKDNSVNVETEYFAKEEADLSDATKVKYLLSFEKITRMYRNARDNGFASYAEA